MSEVEGDRLISRKYASYGPMLVRALTTARAGGVKEHTFRPSGRVIRTVVGRLGDEFVDPERHYCSCSDFFFRVLNGRAKTCYHLLSYAIATELGKVDVIRMDDEEYGRFYSMLTKDVFGVLDRSGGVSPLHLP